MRHGQRLFTRRHLFRMPSEQVKPNKPNFRLVLVLFCVTILAVLVLALVFVKVDGKHLSLGHRSQHSSTSVVVFRTSHVFA